MVGVDPPAYITCTQSDVTLESDVESHNSSQQNSNNDSQDTSGLPIYDDIFKDAGATLTEVAIVSESGEVTFKSYEEVFSNSVKKLGETSEASAARIERGRSYSI